jgi:hypothetical protein
MSLGFKRLRSTGEQAHSASSFDRTDAESLFEKEWDELVIRYDAESHSYRVGVSSEPHQQLDESTSAKDHP